MIREKFLNLITNDFNADAEFLSSRLPLLMQNATSSLIKMFGSDKFKDFKQQVPVAVTDVEDNEDGTVNLEMDDISQFEEDDTVVLYGCPEMDYNTVVLAVTEAVAPASASITVVSAFDDKWEIDDLKVATQFYDDFSTAGAYMCAYHSVLLLRKTTADNGAIGSMTFGNGSSQTITMSELSDLQQKYLDRVNDIMNQYKDEDADTHGVTMFFV
jgi:hypothetical protein